MDRRRSFYYDHWDPCPHPHVPHLLAYPDRLGSHYRGFGRRLTAQVMDLGLVAHLASLRSSVPFVHFFDGTSLGKPSRRMQQKSPFGEGRCFCWGGLVEVGHKGRDVCFGGKSVKLAETILRRNLEKNP